MTGKSVCGLLLSNRRVLLGAFAVICLVFPGAILTLFRVKTHIGTTGSFSFKNNGFCSTNELYNLHFHSYFQAYNNTKLPFILNSLAQWLFYAPMLYLLLMVLSVSPSTAFWVSSATPS